MIDIAFSFIALLPLLASTLLAERVGSLSPDAQRRLAAFAGGVAAAYVFLLILPKLTEQQILLEQATSGWPLIEYFYKHAYVVALIGFVMYYLVNIMEEATDVAVPRTARGVVLIIGFAAYSAAIGDMIAAQGTQPLPLALFSVALTLHLLGLNISLYSHLPRSWGWLRLVLTACLLIGWIVGTISPIPAAVQALIAAWLAGGIIVLVVLIELPSERRPRAFVAGILSFSVLLKLSLNLMSVEGGI